MARDVLWVALLRGINIGPRNRIAMAELRDLVDALGLGPATTYIASGNVLFRAPKAGRAALARRLERAILETFGVTAPVVLRTTDELRGIVAAHPFGRDKSKSYVTFFASKPSAAGARTIDVAAIAPDRFELRGSDV